MTMCECIGCEIVKIKDHMRAAIWNSGAKGYVVGVSGGIDSAVALALAVKAVGNERVIGVSMPSATNSPNDASDAKELSELLRVRLITVEIGDVLSTLTAKEQITNTPILAGNMAARVRMTVLYNIAAANGYLVCGTSNKTEYLIGYSTKWGDGAADIQPLLHLYKKDVYAIAKELAIPENIIQKAPSAGFFDGQTDENEIGMTYAELDSALWNLELNDFVAQNDLEARVLSMVHASEHKRKPPVFIP